MRLSYVRPGIGWFPDYSIVLDGNGRAKLMMRATLVDDGEDLRDTDVFFAVGYPNFAFGGTESPLSGRQSLKLGEIGVWRIGAALLVWTALAFAHPYLFGVAALP